MWTTRGESGGGRLLAVANPLQRARASCGRHVIRRRKNPGRARMAIQGGPQSSRASLSLGGPLRSRRAVLLPSGQGRSRSRFHKESDEGRVGDPRCGTGRRRVQRRATHGELPKKSVSPATLSPAPSRTGCRDPARMHNRPSTGGVVSVVVLRPKPVSDVIPRSERRGSAVETRGAKQRRGVRRWLAS
jgi:hypothetical protein